MDPASSSTVDATGGRRTVLVAVVLALVACLGYHLAAGDLYLNLRDEGYLWYGVEAVRAGEVPLLDFQAYDPGRYYWCELFAPLFGSGIVGIRGAVSLFHAVGMVFGLLVLRRLLPSDRWLVPAALLLLLWGFPRFKLFESAITLAGTWALCRVVERPRARRWLVAGLITGTAAFFGRNHGVYLALSSLVVAGLLAWRGRLAAPRHELGALAGGVLLGYAPMLLLLCLVPGFAAAFWTAVLSILDRGANLPLPFPWDWRPALAEHGVAGGVVLQLGFLLPVVALPLGLSALLRTPAERLEERAALVAATIVGAVYVHHYSVRADLPHLAQAVAPVLVLLVALAPTRRATALVLLGLLAHAGVLAARHHPELRHFDPTVPTPALATYEHDGATLRLKEALARHLSRVRTTLEQVVPAEDELFIAPTRPSLYPLLSKRSPTWWIYFLWPATAEEQRETLRRLDERGVRWALIVEKSFTDDETYDFRNTNPLVWEQLETSWTRIGEGVLPPDYYLFRRGD